MVSYVAYTQSTIHSDDCLRRYTVTKCLNIWIREAPFRHGDTQCVDFSLSHRLATQWHQHQIASNASRLLFSRRQSLFFFCYCCSCCLDDREIHPNEIRLNERWQKVARNTLTYNVWLIWIQTPHHIHRNMISSMTFSVHIAHTHTRRAHVAKEQSLNNCERSEEGCGEQV